MSETEGEEQVERDTESDPTCAAKRRGGAFVGVLLAAWVIFLAAFVLWNVQEPGPRKAPGTYDAAAYARILETPERVFPGYPFTALDAVRGLFNPFLHMSRRAFLGSTVFFVALLCLATYLAGSAVAGRSAGLLAALLVASSPFVVTAARTYDVHVPKLLAITIVIAALLRLHKWPSWRSALVAVAALLVGTWICSSSTEYLLFGTATSGIIAAVFLDGLARRGHRRLFAVTAVAMLACVALSAASILAAPPFPGWMPPYVRLSGIMSATIDPSKTVWRDPSILLAYPHILFSATLGPYLAAVTAVGLVLFAFRKDAPRLVLLAGLLVPLLIIAAMPKRNFYYVATLLPLLSICAAAGLDRVLGKLGRVWLVAAVIAAVVWNLGVGSGRVAPGRVPQQWVSYFVPGRISYSPGNAGLGLEPMGTPANDEELRASQLADRLLPIPRPAALGFFGKPCIQERLALELAWRGIFARDLLCAPPDPSLIAYDAVAVTGPLLRIEGVADASSLAEIHGILIRAAEGNSPDEGRLHPETGGRIIDRSQMLAALERARGEIERLSVTYSRRTRVGDYLLFFRP